MTAAVLTALLVFVVPWLVLWAYIAGVRYERRRQERLARASWDRHAESAIRLNTGRRG